MVKIQIQELKLLENKIQEDNFKQEQKLKKDFTLNALKGQKNFEDFSPFPLVNSLEYSILAQFPEAPS
jgi:hypothetical protein